MGSFCPVGSGQSKAKTLSEAGISTSAASRFEKVAAIPGEKFEAVIQRAKENNKPVPYSNSERV